MEEVNATIMMKGYQIKISKNGLLSLTDLVRMGRSIRAKADLPTFNMTAWMTRKSTKLFVTDLGIKFEPVLIKDDRGDQWGHPFVFINLAMDLFPLFKLSDHDWLNAYVMNYNNKWIDSYKKMIGYLYTLHKNSQSFPAFIAETNDKIRQACNVADWDKPIDHSLKIKRNIENNICLMCEIMTDAEHAVDIGIAKSTWM